MPIGGPKSAEFDAEQVDWKALYDGLPDLSLVGERLPIFYKSFSASKTALQQQRGPNRETLSNWENGKSKPSDSKLNDLRISARNFLESKGCPKKTADDIAKWLARGSPPKTSRAGANKKAPAAPENTQETAEAVASTSFKKPEDSPSSADDTSAGLIRLIDDLNIRILRVVRDPLSEFCRGQGIGRCPTIPTPEELGGVINREIIRAARELREHLRRFVGLQHTPGKGLNLVVSTIDRWASYIDVSGSAVRQVGCRLIPEDTPGKTQEALDDCREATHRLLEASRKAAASLDSLLPPGFVLTAHEVKVYVERKDRTDEARGAAEAIQEALGRYLALIRTVRDRELPEFYSDPHEVYLKKVSETLSDCERQLYRRLLAGQKLLCDRWLVEGLDLRTQLYRQERLSYLMETITQGMRAIDDEPEVSVYDTVGFERGRSAFLELRFLLLEGCILSDEDAIYAKNYNFATPDDFSSSNLRPWERKTEEALDGHR